MHPLTRAHARAEKLRTRFRTREETRDVPQPPRPRLVAERPVPAVAPHAGGRPRAGHAGARSRGGAGGRLLSRPGLLRAEGWDRAEARPRLPRGAVGPCPAVVCLHGGGWVAGSRKSTRPMLGQLARRG